MTPESFCSEDLSEECHHGFRFSSHYPQAYFLDVVLISRSVGAGFDQVAAAHAAIGQEDGGWSVRGMRCPRSDDSAGALVVLKNGHVTGVRPSRIVYVAAASEYVASKEISDGNRC